MRKPFVLFVMLIVAWPHAAAAKSNEIGMIVPGERVTYRSDVGMPSSDAAAAAARVPHFAYIDKGRSGREDATLAGPVTLRHLDPDDRYLRYRMSFVVPDVPPGRYQLLICDAGCDDLLGRLGIRLHVVSSDVERDLRNRIKTHRFQLGARIKVLRRRLNTEIEVRDIRQRYQASRALDLASRLERLEDRPLPATGRGTVPALWLVGLGFAGGIFASALASRLGRRSLKLRAQRSIT